MTKILILYKPLIKRETLAISKSRAQPLSLSDYSPPVRSSSFVVIVVHSLFVVIVVPSVVVVFPSVSVVAEFPPTITATTAALHLHHPPHHCWRPSPPPYRSVRCNGNAWSSIWSVAMLFLSFPRHLLHQSSSFTGAISIAFGLVRVLVVWVTYRDSKIYRWVYHGF